MRKNIAEDKEKLKEKLSYIGLNLERIPKFLTEFKPFSFRPSKSYNDTGYKIYKYIDVNDVEILLTPTDRLTNLDEKYKLSAPIKNYLDSKTEQNVEYFATFLKLLNDTNIEDIDKIEKEQEKIKQQMPNQVKYEGNYTWQIYYSDVSDQYFMLVPTNEYNNSALFYLLKKQIESKKSRRKEIIFVPVSYQEYSGNYLLKSQIADIENYLWYFNKEWPTIYEVYDIKGKMQLKIVGKADVYENLKSDYTITIGNKEDAIKQYKLIKALFILSTAFPDDFNFKTNIDEEGSLQFCYQASIEKKIIDYNELTSFIQYEANQKKMLINLEEKKIQESQNKLQEIKEEVEKQTNEYLSKQRQISTFLECKKSFFGKVKYYFSSRKRELKPTKKDEERVRVKEKNKKEEKSVQQTSELKQFTIEDLIEICTKLESRQKMVKSLKADEKALELKKINLERKIKNANIYLNEIELHKKSIFEFWKFSNKDELPSLNEGEEEENTAKEKIAKSFNYELDIENFGIKVDELQRRKLSKSETDGVFAIKHVLKSAQILHENKSDELTEKQRKLIQQELDLMKKSYEDNIETIELKDFDVFGSISDDNTKVKTLNNKKHREIEKDKYKVLNISKQTDLDLYIDTIRNYLNLVKEAFCKITTSQNIPVYMTSTKKINNKNLNVLHLDINKAISENLDKDEVYLYKINIKEAMPILYYSNIMFFDNMNQTLPLGMNISDEVLIDLSKYKLLEVKKEDFKINYLKDEYTNKIIQVKSVEYNVK